MLILGKLHEEQLLANVAVLAHTADFEFQREIFERVNFNFSSVLVAGLAANRHKLGSGAQTLGLSGSCVHEFQRFKI